MIRKYMLDTNMVSYIIRGRSQAARIKLAGLYMDEVACISTITEAELRYGLAKGPDVLNRRTSLDWFLARLKVLSWGREEADVYGRLRAKQEASGKTLESMDMMIAAHAISTGATLVTRDKAFSYVPDLPGMENWATEL